MIMTKKFLAGVAGALLPLLSACVTQVATMNVPVSPLAVELPQTEGGNVTVDAADSATASSESGEIQRLTPLRPDTRSRSQADWSQRFSADDEIRVAVENMPLSQFLHYAFGELLGANYLISDGLQNLEAPVSLNLQESVSSRRLYTLATELLAGRDVGVTFRDGVFYLHPLNGAAKGGATIGFGARAEDVPDTPGAIMQIIPLRFGLSTSLERTIRDLVTAKVVGDTQQNALFVTGERFEILKVLDVVGLMDQPSRRGRYVGLVSLTYVTAEEYMGRIVELLGVEGVRVNVGAGTSTGTGSAALVSLESVGAVAIFAATRQILDRVEFWTRQLDRPTRGAERRYYIYTPRYARADELGMSLVPLLGDPADADLAPGTQARDTRSALGVSAMASAMNSALQTRRSDSRQNSSQPLRNPVSVRSKDLTMAVDLRSNALIFNTTGTRYQTLLPMIRRLDTPPRQILVEVTIAEVLLTDEFAMGVEFALQNGDVSIGTTGGLGLPDGGGFISVIGTSGAIKAQLSASNRLINVLSNPSLLVRDGVMASISVGNDIPTVGATFFDPLQFERAVTSIVYRKTGVNLTVRPTLNAQGWVVMEISTEISNVVEGGSDVEGTPAIFERSLSTEVVARSGETILLGGLIAENKTETVAKVPWLGDIPFLGGLFRSTTESTERTELVIMITPRVIDQDTKWRDILDSLDGALRYLSLSPAENATNSGETTTE